MYQPDSSSPLVSVTTILLVEIVKGIFLFKIQVCSLTNTQQLNARGK